MSAPWSGFGSILFERSEAPIFGTDRGWNRAEPSVSRSRPLGSATDSIVTLAVGSAEREFECFLTSARAVTLESLVGTTDLFTDWNRPTPDSRQAYLLSVVRIERVTVYCPDPDGLTVMRWRVQVRLVSQ